MASIELTPRDAPAGLGYVAAFSGDQDIVAFARDATEEQHLADDGFLSANGAVFVPADRVDGGKLTPRDPIVQSTVVVFSRGVGASSTLRRYVADVRDRQLTGATAGARTAARRRGVPPRRHERRRLDGDGLRMEAREPGARGPRDVVPTGGHAPPGDAHRCARA